MNPQDAPLRQQVLTLPGAIALSPFRVEKLLASLPRALAEAITVDARFVHFVAVAEPPAREEAAGVAQPPPPWKPPQGEAPGGAPPRPPRFRAAPPGSPRGTRTPPHGRRVDDVRAGQLRALPPQDLQRVVDDRRAGAGALALRDDPQHRAAQPAGDRGRLLG